ncbi:MAG: acyl-CoA dehydratase activase [Syntrophorhabdaceae bacterium]|nr:acyl-CoA dehydratase activase [Syntrophorhabdaceae bacterium]
MKDDMAFVLGIDLGSGYSKAVVCEGGVARSHAVMPSGGNYKDSARAVSEAALQKINLSRGDIRYTLATGYGAGMVDFADETMTDISCHGAGIHHIFPSVRTLIDIGAQFSRVIRVNDEGKVTFFVMNEKCAGGSGKFLQVIARILKISLEEISELSLTAVRPVEFTTGCAVFAESEAVSRIAEGALPGDILAGIHKAMASKIMTLVTRVGLEEDCAVTGGGAKDLGLVKAIGAELGIDVLVADEPQITAALGAALLASQKIS